MVELVMPGLSAPAAEEVVPLPPETAGPTLAMPTTRENVTPPVLSNPTEAMAILPGLKEGIMEFVRGLSITSAKIGGWANDAMRYDPLDHIFGPIEGRDIRDAGPDFNAIAAKQMATPAQSYGGMAIRDMGRLVAAYAPLAMASAPAGLSAAARTFLLGPTAGMVAFDPYEMRLSNLTEELTRAGHPKMADAIKTYIAANPDDPLPYAMLKQAAEDVALAGTGEVALSTARAAYHGAIAFRRYAADKLAAQTMGVTPPTAPHIYTAEEVLQGKAVADFRAADIADEIARSDMLNAAQTFGATTKQAKIDMLADVYYRRLKGEGLDLSDTEIVGKTEQFRRWLDQEILPRPAATSAGQEIARRLADTRKQQEAEARAASARAAGTLKENLTTTLVDRSGNLKRELERAGDAGKEAVMRFELAAGATPAASRAFRTAQDSIYVDLSIDDHKLLDEIIMARVNVGILGRKPDFVTGPDVKDPTTGKMRPPRMQDYEDALVQMRGQLGEAKYALLMDRANRYQMAVQQVVDELDHAGMLLPGEADKLKRWDYAPFEFINQIDPVTHFKRNGVNMSVTSSGIEPLEEAGSRLFNMDTETLLAQMYARTYSRMFRNNVGVAMRDVAEASPDNGIVSSKAKNGWVEQVAMEGGELKKFWINPEYWDEWAPTEQKANQLLMWASGVNIVKPLATGYNPAFVLRNFPRDLLHIWTTTTDYNTVAPFAALQMSVDLAKVFGDAVFRRGSYDAYIREGGGMDLLSNQGQMRATANIPITYQGRKTQQYTSNALRALGYLNETSEIITRLMHRERLLAEGASPEQATWQARRRLDFAQGGSYTKGAEQVVPYINAAAQGYRTLLRGAKTDLVAFTAKTTQLAGIFGGMYLAQREHPGWADVPDHVKAMNMIVMRPEFYDDQTGRHYLYYKFPIDHSAIWLKGSIDSAMNAYFEDKKPSREMVAAIASSASLLPGATLPPTVAAAVALFGNYNWWQGQEIWKGDENIDPLQKLREYPDVPTSVMAVDTANIIAKFTGNTIKLPPAQLQGAVEQVIPQNVYTDIMGLGYQAATRGLDDLMSKTTLEMLGRAPIISAVTGFTNQFNRTQTGIQQATLERGGIVAAQDRELDNMLAHSQANPRKTSAKDVSDYINSQTSAEDRARLYDRMQRTMAVQSIFAKYDLNEVTNGPGPVWWIQLSGADREVRAQMFVEEWKDAVHDDTAGKRRLQSMRELTLQMPGFKEAEFRRDLDRRIRQLGLEGL